MTGSEALLITALNAVLPEGVTAFGDVPATRPTAFVTVERTGGERTLFLDRGTYALQCWAQSRAQAATLADEVSSALLSLPASSGRVGATAVASVYNFPDPDSGTARYQITATAVVTTS